MELQEGHKVELLPITVTYYKKDVPNLSGESEKLPNYYRDYYNGGWFLPPYTVLELREWFSRHELATIFSSHAISQGGIVIHTFYMSDYQETKRSEVNE